MDPEETKIWFADYTEMYQITNYLLQARFQKDLLGVLYYCDQGMKKYSDHTARLQQQQDMALAILWRNLNTGMLNTNEMLQQINQIVQKDEHFGTAWLIKSWVYSLRNEMQQAIECAEKAVQYAPDLALARRNLNFISKMQK